MSPENYPEPPTDNQQPPISEEQTETEQEAKTEDALPEDAKTEVTESQPEQSETQEAETQEVETQEVETQEAETQEAETQEAETQEAETQEAETQEAETQEAETQETTPLEEVETARRITDEVVESQPEPEPVPEPEVVSESPAPVEEVLNDVHRRRGSHGSRSSSGSHKERRRKHSSDSSSSDDSHHSKSSRKSKSKKKGKKGVSNKELRNVFELVDQSGNNSGRLNSQQVIKAIRCLGRNPTKQDEDNITNAVESDHGGSLDYESFESFVTPHLKDVEYERKLLEKAFKTFDRNGDDKVSLVELKQVLCNTGDQMEEEELDTLFQEWDLDGNGWLNYKEFALAMCSLDTL